MTDDIIIEAARYPHVEDNSVRTTEGVQLAVAFQPIFCVATATLQSKAVAVATICFNIKRKPARSSGKN
jgi:hypothetical protein